MDHLARLVPMFLRTQLTEYLRPCQNDTGEQNAQPHHPYQEQCNADHTTHRQLTTTKPTPFSAKKHIPTTVRPQKSKQNRTHTTQTPTLANSLTHSTQHPTSHPHVAPHPKLAVPPSSTLALTITTPLRTQSPGRCLRHHLEQLAHSPPVATA